MCVFVEKCFFIETKIGTKSTEMCVWVIISLLSLKPVYFPEIGKFFAVFINKIWHKHKFVVFTAMSFYPFMKV